MGSLPPPKIKSLDISNYILRPCSLVEQLPHTDAKTERPEQRHQHRHTPEQNMICLAGEEEKVDDHAPAAKGHHSRENETLGARH
jgi:hypothetical protein